MRLVDLPRTSSFRLALRFLLLFGAAALILFGFLDWQTNRYVIGRMDFWLVREQMMFGALDRDTLLQHLTAHLVADPTLERPMTLFDPSGDRLAGTALDLPAAELAGMPQDIPFEFDLPQGRHGMVFRAMAHRRPSGDLMLVALDMEPQFAFADVLINVFIWRPGHRADRPGRGGDHRRRGGAPHQRGHARHSAHRERRSVGTASHARPDRRP